MADPICNDCTKRKDYPVKIVMEWCPCGISIVRELEVNGKKIAVRPKSVKKYATHSMLSNLVNTTSPIYSPIRARGRRR